MSREARRGRLLDLADRRGLGAVLLRAPANFAWYTGGADNRVDHASPFGVADAVVTPEAEYVLTDNIEAPRMREEQTPGMEVVEYPWREGPAKLLRNLADGGALGADVPVAGASNVSEKRTSLCYVLDPDAIERYRKVGADAAAAVEEAAGNLDPGPNEWEPAGASGLKREDTGRARVGPREAQACGDDLRRLGVDAGASPGLRGLR